MFVSAIVVAAGKSKRFKPGNSKVLLKLNSQPVIAYSLDVLSREHQIKEIIVVANPQNIAALRKIIRKNKFHQALKLVLGGKERRDSVAGGLKAIDAQADFVLIHDAARPFITSGLVARVIQEAQKSKAAILGVPVKPTIKLVTRSPGHQVTSNFVIRKTLNRNALWEAQTPQVFEKDLILKAYRKFGGIGATDDASLVERSGKRVKIVMGAYHNIKITTPEDMVIAEAICHTK